MGQYYYLDGSEPIGPLSLQDVYTLIDREVVGPATLMCREGGSDWQNLLLIHELTGKSAAKAATDDSSISSSRSTSGSNRRTKRLGTNATAIIIATLLSIVAIYVAYAITHQSQDMIQEMDHLPGQ